MVHTNTRRAFLKAVGATTAFGTLTAIAGTPAEAQSPVSGSGTGAITGLQVTSVREAGGNRHEDRILHGTIDGTLDGTFVEHVSGTVHKSGRVVLHGTMTFTGTVGDCGDGTVNLAVSGRGHIAQPGFPIVKSTVRVINQAENTVDVTGQGTVLQEGPDLTYDIQYVCR